MRHTQHSITFTICGVCVTSSSPLRTSERCRETRWLSRATKPAHPHLQLVHVRSSVRASQKQSVQVLVEALPPVGWPTGARQLARNGGWRDDIAAVCQQDGRLAAADGKEKGNLRETKTKKERAEWRETGTREEWKRGWEGRWEIPLGRTSSNRTVHSLHKLLTQT